MKCYILGAVSGASENSIKIFGIYKAALNKKNEVLGTPIETSKFNGSNSERFLIAKNSIQSSDLVIADLSQASTGVGIELAMAHLLNKKILCFAKTGSKVSGLALGMIENSVIFYKDSEDLFNLIQENIL